MISYCNFIPDVIWVRESDNGIRHVTLRRNFIEETIAEEIQFRFDETDVYIPDRDNIQNYIETNFDALFEQGLVQTGENKIQELKMQRTQQLISTGQVAEEIDNLQEQVLTLMGV